MSGQTARFECIAQAEPPPSILWSKNGRIIENSPDYQIHFRNGVCRLSIPQAYPGNFIKLYAKFPNSHRTMSNCEIIKFLVFINYTVKGRIRYSNYNYARTYES